MTLQQKQTILNNLVQLYKNKLEKYQNSNPDRYWLDEMNDSYQEALKTKKAVLIYNAVERNLIILSKLI